MSARAGRFGRAKKAALALALSAAVAVLAGACKTPTQATLDVSYTGDCSELSNVAFIVGTDPYESEGRVRTKVFTTSAPCQGKGVVGTLVVTPNDATARASVIVMAGVGDRRAEECTPDNGYFGCIIARRTFTFVAATALLIPIVLDPDCKNVPCDAVSTCRKGKCASSDIECREDGACSAPGEAADGGTTFVDAPTDPDAYVQSDTGGKETGPPTDGGNDANDGATSTCGTPEVAVECNTTASGPQTCASVDQSCCFGPGGAFAGPDAASPDATVAGGYACRNAGSCPSPPSTTNDPNVECRGKKNCAPGSICCQIPMYGGSFCQTTCPNPFGDGGPPPVQYCLEDCECPAGKTCQPTSPIGTTTPQPMKSCQ